MAVGGAAGVGEAGCVTAGDSWATQGTIGIIKAERGRNLGGTIGAGRGATRG
jgi:hypothetical protein